MYASGTAYTLADESEEECDSDVSSVSSLNSYDEESDFDFTSAIDSSINEYDRNVGATNNPEEERELISEHCTEARTANDFVGDSDEYICKVCFKTFESSHQLLLHSVEHPELVACLPQLKEVSSEGDNKECNKAPQTLEENKVQGSNVGVQLSISANKLNVYLATEHNGPVESGDEGISTQLFNLGEHDKGDDCEGTYRCEMCSKSFESSTELDKHFVGCDVCFNSFHSVQELHTHNLECHAPKDDIQEKTSHIKTTDESCAMDGTQTGGKRKKTDFEMIVNFWKENFYFADEDTQISAQQAYKMFKMQAECPQINFLAFTSYSLQTEGMKSFCERGSKIPVFYAKPFEMTPICNIKKPKLTPNIATNSNSMPPLHSQKDTFLSSASDSLRKNHELNGNSKDILRQHKCKVCLETFESARQLLSHSVLHPQLVAHFSGLDVITKPTNSNDVFCQRTSSVCGDNVQDNRPMSLMDVYIESTPHELKYRIGAYKTAKRLKDESDAVEAQSSISEIKKEAKCPICGFVYPNDEYRKQHQNYHTAKKSKCPDCHKWFLNRDIMMKHHKLHLRRKHGSTPTGGFDCVICHKWFNSRNSYKKHKKISHQGETFPVQKKLTLEKKEFKCGICQKVFQEKKNLKRHKKVEGHGQISLYSVDQPLECAKCHECFLDIKDLSLHQIMHEKEKLSEGSLPIESIANRIDSAQTKNTVNETPQEVPINTDAVGVFALKSKSNGFMKEDSNTFNSTGKLNTTQLGVNYSKMHTDKFKCDFCHKSFTYKKQLRTHENREHDGIQSRLNKTPFHCEKCNTYFLTKDLLSEDILKHEKMFQGPMCKTDIERGRCILCNEIFMNPKCLAYHESIRHPNLQIECEVKGCHFTFKHKADMLRHKSTHKKMEWDEKVKEAFASLKYEEEVREYNAKLREGVEDPEAKPANFKFKSKEYISDSDSSSLEYVAE